ncbi:uncharacterized protein LOC129600669 [Paramacrobiotus metropolitanus]|uniref:uncharacterized protein LOC129600669 n=1 Tax=Paramacrobiotus metropolitanus TaxID=2943436 RepID=UPI0024464B29|nr:uncharacterized protein LOC129600669 [Paramacrobiotus metropolitanus]
MDSDQNKNSQPAEHGQGGSLGIEMDSSAPHSTAPATLHFHQVPVNLHSVGHEPVVGPAPTTQKPGHLVQAASYPPASHSDSSRTNPNGDKPKNPEEGVLGQVIHKASEIIGDVKERAGDVLGPALGELKDRATGVWQTVAGVVGAVPGKELREDQSEVIVTGADEGAAKQPGQELGVNISSYQPPVNSPAGIYLHGDIQVADKDGQRPTQIVGTETATKQKHS